MGAWPTRRPAGVRRSGAKKIRPRSPSTTIAIIRAPIRLAWPSARMCSSGTGDSQTRHSERHAGQRSPSGATPGGPPIVNDTVFETRSINRVAHASPSLLRQVERSNKGLLGAAGRVRAGDSARPQPGDHRRFAAASLLRKTRLRVQVADSAFRLVAHPRAVAADILSEPVALPRARATDPRRASG